MGIGEIVAIARPDGGRRGQHGGRQRHPDHLPGPARLRLRAGHGERLQHDRPRPRLDLGRLRLPPRARGPANGGHRGSAPCRRSAGSPARCSCWSCPPRPSRRSCRSSSLIALVLVVLQPRISAWLERAQGGGGARAPGPGPLGVFAHRRLRRLLRRRPGDPAARHPRRHAAPGPAAHQRAEERIRGAHQRRRRRSSSSSRPRRLGAGGDHRRLSVVGGQIGARYGRRLDPGVLRALIVVVGATAIVKLLLD